MFALSTRSFARALLTTALTAAPFVAGCSSDPNSLGGSGSGSGADTSTGGTGSATNPPSTGNASGDCVNAINTYRASVGKKALARWTDSETCASGEAKSDSSSGKAHGAFGTCTEMAQDECPGWPGPAGDMITDCLKAMWAEGPGGGHYENMKGDYTKVACGFYTLPNGNVWAVQNFR